MIDCIRVILKLLNLQQTLSSEWLPFSLNRYIFLFIFQSWYEVWECVHSDRWSQWYDQRNEILLVSALRLEFSLSDETVPQKVNSILNHKEEHNQYHSGYLICFYDDIKMMIRTCIFKASSLLYMCNMIYMYMQFLSS